jgi:hypothetical protein
MNLMNDFMKHPTGLEDGGGEVGAKKMPMR